MKEKRTRPQLPPREETQKRLVEHALSEVELKEVELKLVAGGRISEGGTYITCTARWV